MDIKAKIIYGMGIIILLLCTGEALVKSIARIDETQVDTHEGSTVLLQCRFPPPREKVTCNWQIGSTLAYAAIENRSLSPNYKVNMNLQEGYYDLEIKNVYERNNGKYICNMIVDNIVFYSKYINLMVLRTPSPPWISLTSDSATEGQKFELQCNTYGGRPEPEVRWYRGNNSSLLHTGKVLIIEPTREDDRTSFRCVVRNRAMHAGETLDASVTLDVNYFPRVTVGPESPLKVEVNGTATLKCYVDSKPRVGMVRWLRDGSFIATNFEHVIPKVTLQDVGRYTCQADNGLEKRTEASLVLDVLYPPTVSIKGNTFREINAGDSVTVYCKVSANPKPSVIEWLRDDRSEFRQSNSTLKLNYITLEDAGIYICRAVNTIHPTGGERKNHSAFASVTIRVRCHPILRLLNQFKNYNPKEWPITPVTKIPTPLRSSFNPENSTLAVNVGATCLPLVASIEKIDGGSDSSWRIVDEWPLEVLEPIQKKGILDDPGAADLEPQLRVRLCLKFNRKICGEYVEAKIESSYIGRLTLIALISGTVFLLFAGLLLLFCRRKQIASATNL